MRGVRGSRHRTGIDYWPGFVDALSTLLLAITFILSVFVVAQYILSQEVSDKDTALQRLNRQIVELTELLALETGAKRRSETELGALAASLDGARREQARLASELAAQSRAGGANDQRAQGLVAAIDAEKQATARAIAAVDVLNQQILALRRQLAALEEALATSENRDKEAQGRIADLGARLNVALAQRVQELARYRSEFFGRLRQVLSGRSDIRIVGDRFVFQSELFFETGGATLSPEGRAEMDKLAAAIIELDRDIPTDIAWVLRVDGHTDKRPVSGAGQFRSNWDLSAARAIAVVQYMVTRGVPPARLVAAGFGEFQPLDAAETDDAFRRNRRIELKLTER